jgi:hypothetical protein
MSGFIFVRTLRGAALFVAGMVAAGTSISVAAPASPSATTYTRVTSCSGLNFHPISSGTDFAWDGGALYRDNTGEGYNGYFLCDPQLPDKARVTMVRFTVRDDAAVAQVRYCALYRQSITLSGANDPGQVLADAGGTGMEATPGYVRLSDSSIGHATIDHAHYAYYLQCQINFVVGKGDSRAQIIGADVTYRISSTNG